MSLNTWIYLHKRGDRSWISSRRRLTKLSLLYHRRRRRREDNDRLYRNAFGYLALIFVIVVGWSAVSFVRDRAAIHYVADGIHLVQVNRPINIASAQTIGQGANFQFFSVTKEGEVLLYGRILTTEAWNRFVRGKGGKYNSPIPILMVDRESEMGTVSDLVAQLQVEGYQYILFSTKLDKETFRRSYYYDW